MYSIVLSKSIHRVVKIPVITLLTLVLLLGCTKDDEETIGNFTVTSLSPSSGYYGDLIIISGKGFAEDFTQNVVTFNGTPTDVQLGSLTELAVVVPSGCTTGAVTVTNAGKTVTGPVFTIKEPTEVTKAYFIKFKMNGVVKIFEEGNPGNQSCGNCACASMPVLSDSRSASLVTCNADNDWVTAADIQSWNGDKVLFSGNTFPISYFSFKENDIDYSSEYVSDQTGSEVNITSVVADGEFFGLKQFKVTGNFKCKVSKSDGMGVASITEGTFVMRYSED